MTIIDFIRHGEPDTHIHDDRLRPLTTRGQRQSHAIATNLIYIPYTAVYASPAARATETVQPLATIIGKEIIHDDRLLERQMPDWVVDFPGYVRKQWTDLTYAQAGGRINRAGSGAIPSVYAIIATGWGGCGRHTWNGYE